VDWTEPTAYLELILVTWLAVVMGYIVIRMLSGSILVTGLFRGEKTAPYGLDRLQLVFVTLFFAAGYVVASLARAPGDPLPDIPAPLMLVLIGSNGTYLAVKFAAFGGTGRGK
jgi:hypothetical protein